MKYETARKMVIDWVGIQPFTNELATDIVKAVGRREATIKALRAEIKKLREAQRVARVLGQYVNQYANDALTTHERAAVNAALAYPETP